MKKGQKKHPFEKCETGYHKFAVEELAAWVGGIVEQPFYIDKKLAFVPDVVTYKNGVIDRVYEVYYSHPLTGYKLGLMMDWCYRNSTELSVFEISAHYILAQTKKPEVLSADCYIIDPFNN